MSAMHSRSSSLNSSAPLPLARPWSSFSKVAPMISYTINVLQKYAKFIGPGIMVSVAYMDPGNYSTAVSAGAIYEYKLLFTVLVSNIFAVILQILCAKLGAVTGLNLAECCRKYLPKWLSITLYILTEIAIIATDLAEVVGTAISLNILLKIPLTIGVLLTVVDVLVVLAAYNPQGPIRIIRYFEYFVSVLVAVVVVCFAVELGKLRPEHPEKIWTGFLPSSELFTQPKAVYLSCGILGATVMPHSLYLGSGIVQPRLKEFDIKKGYYSALKDDSGEDSDQSYQPSLAAIKSCMKFTIAELVISLCTIAIFVNSAILIVAGTTMYKTEQAYDADLFSIYDMLVEFLGQAAGTVFALALLFSGQSAGIVCTLAGQMVSEGFISWTVRPWLRRVVTRVLAIAPCLFVSLFVGRSGLASVLNASQVVLSLLLPFVTAPLIYFTGSKAIMRVPTEVAVTETVALRHQPVINSETNSFNSTPASEEGELPVDITCAPGYVQLGEEGQTYCDLSNSPLLQWSSLLIFILVSGLNIFLLISMWYE